jgi:hypothetical protein
MASSRPWDAILTGWCSATERAVPRQPLGVAPGSRWGVSTGAGGPPRYLTGVPAVGRSRGPVLAAAGHFPPPPAAASPGRPGPLGKVARGLAGRDFYFFPIFSARKSTKRS